MDGPLQTAAGQSRVEQRLRQIEERRAEEAALLERRRAPSLLAAALLAVADDPMQRRAVQQALRSLLDELDDSVPGCAGQRAVGLDALRFLNAQEEARAVRMRPVLHVVK
ncbi:hypothetical protein [Zavarzinia sp. CC-PAN008]|uniref:hypothetical protein n=1 Tax=Zavarzinia sp. CC-PAN008 TaxID=3243332 RepID=UPI003F74601D